DAPTPTMAALSNSLAYIGPDGNVYVIHPGETVPTPITTDADAKSPLDMTVYTAVGLGPRPEPTHVYCCVQWSPDASQLTFIDIVTKQLFVAALDDHRPRLVAAGATPLHPGSAWSPDGTQFVYLRDDRVSKYGPGEEIRVMPVAGGTARTIGANDIYCERDGPGPELAGYILNSERGHSNFHKPVSLVWTSRGLLYGNTVSCNGLALVSADGEIIWQDNRLLSPFVAPDQTRMVAEVVLEHAPYAEIALVERDTGQTTTLPLDARTTDVLGWTADGAAILYATYALISQTPNTGPESDPLNKYPALWEATTTRMTLWQRRLSDGQTQTLFTAQGYWIGLLSTNPDGSALALSLVTSGEALLQAKNEGAAESELEKLMPHPEVVIVPLNGEPPVWLGPGGQPAFSPIRR
ncbi:MAG TPA: hypothetical protein VHO69_12890, partial [Phototrophicaceae bacterium]|nr:hypothetical protein [Phototrophicaceae bacterium]